MDADRPVTDRTQDRLGFGPVAEHLAQSIARLAAESGFVFGIEGKWGSGKSTLVYLTIDALRRHDPAPEIVFFSPWLVGARDKLLQALFDELATAAAKIDPIATAIDDVRPARWRRTKKFFQRDEHWKLRQRERLKRSIGRQLKSFGAMTGAATKLAGIAELLGLTGASAVGKAVESGTQAFPRVSTISKRKDQLVAALRLLSRRIVVFVDDLDRLEPSEASEMLRLIRAVADFPNVIYVLSYDPEVLGQTLKEAVQVDDGQAFLEKIVQVTFRVPRPEAFDLRAWFRSQLATLFPQELDPAVRTRLADVIDTHGGRYLETPRDVVRTLNALRLHAVPVADRIDLADMMWLQLIRVGKPELYAWAEEYLTDLAAIANGAMITEAGMLHASERLRALLSEDGVDLTRAIIDLSLILPGVGERGFGNERRIVFNDLGAHAFDNFITARRIGSPQHYRYYFAFAQPAGALSDDVVRAFLSAAETAPHEAVAQFAALGGQARAQGGTMAEVMVDRLTASAPQIPLAVLPGICAALANGMDIPALASPNSDFGQPRSWAPAQRLIHLLLRRSSVAPDVRQECLRVLFSQGSALGWLTTILRSEIFAHGHFGDRPEPEDQRMLTAAEFAGVLDTMINRYRSAAPDELLGVPNMLSLLYVWMQGARNDEASVWAQQQIATDAGLLRLLSRARSWRATNDVVYYPLKRDDLARFLDYDAAVQRLRDVASRETSSADDRRLASELLAAVDQDRRDRD